MTGAPEEIPSVVEATLLGDAPSPDGAAPGYQMRISRLTIDKLGVKLYDKASAVVAELVANSYDADAEGVIVEVPLGVSLAKKGATEVEDKGYSIVVTDDGHGMTPKEAQDYFLIVGTDRRERPSGTGSTSREKLRPVMGRKGIGKLSPFGICRRIEVLSSGGDETDDGFLTSHFILDFEKLVRDEDGAVDLEVGSEDRTFRASRGTVVTLSDFLPKRVPSSEVFIRQLARRFSLSKPDFAITIVDEKSKEEFPVPGFAVPVNEDTKVDVSGRPVPFGDTDLPVTGWLAFAKEAYKDEEEAGVRIYARGKIVATTRDFEQPAGFTGEFTARSYLVGEVHAEWLDEDDDDDLVRTDRQGILWDSEKGEALRAWGMVLIKEIAKASAGPRRTSKAEKFLKRSDLEKRARERFADASVVDAAVKLGQTIGAFASEDELGDPDYVNDLANVILSVAPHQALVTAFREIAGHDDSTTMDELLDLFGKTRVAEMASYAQIAVERVQSINHLREVISDPDTVEGDLQKLIASAPWLVQPDWSVITENQSLKNFRNTFLEFWKKHYKEEPELEIAISYEKKRPDFTLINIGQQLRLVELKKPDHAFANDDFGRMHNYVVVFKKLFDTHGWMRDKFPGGFQIDLITDSENITDEFKKVAFDSYVADRLVKVSTWDDFLHHATVSLEMFLDVHDKAKEVAKAASESASTDDGSVTDAATTPDPTAPAEAAPNPLPAPVGEEAGP